MGGQAENKVWNSSTRGSNCVVREEREYGVVSQSGWFGCELRHQWRYHLIVICNRGIGKLLVEVVFYDTNDVLCPLPSTIKWTFGREWG